MLDTAGNEFFCNSLGPNSITSCSVTIVYSGSSYHTHKSAQLTSLTVAWSVEEVGDSDFYDHFV